MCMLKFYFTMKNMFSAPNAENLSFTQWNFQKLVKDLKVLRISFLLFLVHAKISNKCTRINFYIKVFR